MKLSQFIMLSEEEKNKAVLHQGVLLAKQKTACEIRFLFQLELFYVELQCSHATKKVCSYQAFTDTRLLESYLDEIPVKGLLE